MQGVHNNCYRYSCDGLILPSVSTILKSDLKRAQARKARGLARSKCNYPSEQYCRERGLAVHAAARNFFKTGEVDLPEMYFPYWENIYKSLSILDLTSIEWADGPVLESLSHLQQGKHSAVWNTKQKYVGCPDLVADCGGLRMLVEFKTTDEPLIAQYDMDFKNYSSWWRYHQASMQVASYAKAYEQTTKRAIDVGCIVVGGKDINQLFFLEKPTLKNSLSKFHKLAKEFHLCDRFVQPAPSPIREPAFV